MKTLNYVLSALLVLSAASCTKQEPTPVTPEVLGFPPVTAPAGDLVRCDHKYSTKLNVNFFTSKKSAYQPPAFPGLTVYHITDVNGNRWSINQYEMENYNCVTFKGK